LKKANNQNGRKYTVISYDAFDLTISEVINGKVDAIILNDAPAIKIAENHPVKILGDAGLPPEEVAYGVNKDNPLLLAILNDGLTALMADPYWQTLIDKYMLGEVQ
jgi:polar amino acid transport system substrate-binding protein